MNPRDILIEFLEEAAKEDGDADALTIFEEGFDDDEVSFNAWCCIFSGYRMAKGFSTFEVDEALVNQVGDYLIGGGCGLH